MIRLVKSFVIKIFSVLDRKLRLISSLVIGVSFFHLSPVQKQIKHKYVLNPAISSFFMGHVLLGY